MGLRLVAVISWKLSHRGWAGGESEANGRFSHDQMQKMPTNCSCIPSPPPEARPSTSPRHQHNARDPLQLWVGGAFYACFPTSPTPPSLGSWAHQSDHKHIPSIIPQMRSAPQLGEGAAPFRCTLATNVLGGFLMVAGCFWPLVAARRGGGGGKPEFWNGVFGADKSWPQF